MGSRLAGHGFNDANASRLGSLEQMLSQAVAGRADEVSRKQSASNAVRTSCLIEVEACRNVCSARGLEKATSVLDTGDQEAPRGPRVAKELAEQLVTLKQAMTDPEVAPVVAEREADDIIAEMDRVIPLLLDADADYSRWQPRPAQIVIRRSAARAAGLLGSRGCVSM